MMFGFVTQGSAGEIEGSDAGGGRWSLCGNSALPQNHIAILRQDGNNALPRFAIVVLTFCHLAAIA
jgi:hypothetical protein